jgi:hypothetical protein
MSVYSIQQHKTNYQPKDRAIKSHMKHNYWLLLTVQNSWLTLVSALCDGLLTQLYITERRNPRNASSCLSLFWNRLCLGKLKYESLTKFSVDWLIAHKASRIVACLLHSFIIPLCEILWLGCSITNLQHLFNLRLLYSCRVIRLIQMMCAVTQYSMQVASMDTTDTDK